MTDQGDLSPDFVVQPPLHGNVPRGGTTTLAISHGPTARLPGSFGLRARGHGHKDNARPNQSEQLEKARETAMAEGSAATKPVNAPPPAEAQPSRIRNFDPLKPPTDKPQSYYDDIEKKFGEERDLRLNYRPEGKSQYITDLEKDADLARYETDPFAEPFVERAPLDGSRRGAVHRRRLLGAADVGAPAREGRREHPHRRARRRRRRHLVLEPLPGHRLRRRRPTTTCRCSTRWATYLPSYYAKGPEIYAHCQAIAKKYDLYELAVFQTTVTRPSGTRRRSSGASRTDRGDQMTAQFVVCANGTLSKPKLARIDGMETLRGPLVPHLALGLRLHRRRTFEACRTRSSASSAPAPPPCRSSPASAEAAKELYVFQRTPSSIDVRDDWPTDPEWAASLQPGWQNEAPR